MLSLFPSLSKDKQGDKVSNVIYNESFREYEIDLNENLCLLLTMNLKVYEEHEEEEENEEN